MLIVRRNKPKLAYLLGKRALAGHDPVTALRLLRSAVDNCPAERHTELSRRLYWLSIALRRLGKDGLAIKALSSAQRLAPRGRARDLYSNFANRYGMPKSDCSEHDDYRAFCSIHIRRYLETVPDRRFSSQDEIDTVLRLIADTWLRLNTKKTLETSACEDKLDVFKETEIDFPALRVLPETARGKTIAVNFKRGQAIFPEDRCSCGSGLPYRMCCGRTRLPYEPERG
jgi:uncharacterized protein YchJ